MQEIFLHKTNVILDFAIHNYNFNSVLCFQKKLNSKNPKITLLSTAPPPL